MHHLAPDDELESTLLYKLSYLEIILCILSIIPTILYLEINVLVIYQVSVDYRPLICPYLSLMGVCGHGVPPQSKELLLHSDEPAVLSL